MNPYDQLQRLGLELPKLPPPVAAYIPGVITGNLVFVSGQIPSVDGKPVYRGKLGQDVSLEQGQQAARLAALNCVAELELVLGDLRRVGRIVKLTGYVASAAGFNDQPKVINGASELLLELFGEQGRHARAALGVAELPGGVPVEVELIAELAAG